MAALDFVSGFPEGVRVDDAKLHSLSNRWFLSAAPFFIVARSEVMVGISQYGTDRSGGVVLASLSLIVRPSPMVRYFLLASSY